MNLFSQYNASYRPLPITGALRSFCITFFRNLFSSTIISLSSSKLLEFYYLKSSRNNPSYSKDFLATSFLIGCFSVFCEYSTMLNNFSKNLGTHLSILTFVIECKVSIHLISTIWPSWFLQALSFSHMASINWSRSNIKPLSRDL